MSRDLAFPWRQEADCFPFIHPDRHESLTPPFQPLSCVASQFIPQTRQVRARRVTTRPITSEPPRRSS